MDFINGHALVREVRTWLFMLAYRSRCLLEDGDRVLGGRLPLRVKVIDLRVGDRRDAVGPTGDGPCYRGHENH